MIYSLKNNNNNNKGTILITQKVMKMGLWKKEKNK